jgi:hypothetical protein
MVDAKKYHTEKHTQRMNKPIIYQLFPRLFANYNETRKYNGTKEENGCGRFVDIN